MVSSWGMVWWFWFHGTCILELNNEVSGSQFSHWWSRRGLEWPCGNGFELETLTLIHVEFHIDIDGYLYKYLYTYIYLYKYLYKYL